MEFLVLDLAATLAAFLGYLATVIWHDVSGEPMSYLNAGVTRAFDVEALVRLRQQYTPPSRTPSDFYEALAPLGLPDPERHRAEFDGWSNRVLRPLGMGG
jgi:hypothetical protein